MLTSTSLPPTIYKCVNPLRDLEYLYDTPQRFNSCSNENCFIPTLEIQGIKDNQNHVPKQYTNSSLSISLQKNCTKVPSKVSTKHWVYGEDTSRLEKFIYLNNKTSGIFLSQLKKNREEKLQENDHRNGFSCLTSIKHRCVTICLKH